MLARNPLSQTSLEIVVLFVLAQPAAAATERDGHAEHVRAHVEKFASHCSNMFDIALRYCCLEFLNRALLV